MELQLVIFFSFISLCYLQDLLTTVKLYLDVKVTELLFLFTLFSVSCSTFTEP